jgi:hypothetical protein
MPDLLVKKQQSSPRKRYNPPFSAMRRSHSFIPSCFEGKITIGKMGPSRGKTHGIHLAQEDHCSHVHCSLLDIGIEFLKFFSSIMNDLGLADIKAALT